MSSGDGNVKITKCPTGYAIGYSPINDSTQCDDFGNEFSNVTEPMGIMGLWTNNHAKGEQRENRLKRGRKGIDK